uniref:NADH dehydrogenase subunit 6 n=1 Tax=Neofoleyellides sp. XM-2022 TaxID=3014012 RepID=A0A9E9G978_9BILA|nr:NADH dehydrogenase subunit 6 [Neofoleyellides sp. XM-2022]
MLLKIFLYMFFLFLLSFIFFCYSIVEYDPLKSCLNFCLGVLFGSIFVSFGVHSWYSYFIILIFLSGVMSMMVYYCSLCGFSYFYSSYIYFFLFSFFFIFFFTYDFCYVFNDYNFLVMYYSYNFFYVCWLVFILMLLLVFVSFNLDNDFCLRSL